MILPLYSIKDKLDQFKQPFVDVNDSLVLRHLMNSLKEKNEFSLNPEDFILYKIGTFDTETGIVVSEIKHIVDVKDLIVNQNGSE